MMAGLVRAERRNATKCVTVKVGDDAFDVWYRVGVFTPQFQRDLTRTERQWQQQRDALVEAGDEDALAAFDEQVSPNARLTARLLSQWDVYDYEYDSDGNPLPNGNGEPKRVRVPVTAEAIHEFDVFVQSAILNAIVEDLAPGEVNASGSLAP
jgi:hypothetical protein